MIVLDASACLELLFNSSIGRVVAERIADPECSLHAPHLIDLEITQCLRRYVGRGQITPQRALQSLEIFLQVDLNRYPHDVLLERIWALRDRLTAYDAAYVALAESLGAELLTCDRKLAQVQGVEVDFTVIR